MAKPLTRQEEDRLDRAVPVRAVRYDEDTGVLGFLPVNAQGGSGNLVIVRLDDGEEFSPEEAEDGFLEAEVGGWSKYGLCTN